MGSTEKANSSSRGKATAFPFKSVILKRANNPVERMDMKDVKSNGFLPIIARAIAEMKEIQRSYIDHGAENQEQRKQVEREIACDDHIEVRFKCGASSHLTGHTAMSMRFCNTIKAKLLQKKLQKFCF